MKNKKGFTLIELLVVISIIALLSSIVLSTLSDARGKARDAKRIQDLRQLQIAIETYYTDNGCYPVAIATPGPESTASTPCPLTISTNMGAGICNTVNQHFNNSLKILVEKGYIASLPTDPINKTDGTTNTDYCYNYSKTPSATSTWSCNGILRSKYEYVIAFSTEKTTLKYPLMTNVPYGSFKYCIAGKAI
jgi:prepilin-type N-terminal cleavage/methylation domain-containing protein